MNLKSALALAIATLGCSLALAQQGVSKDTILIGTIHDQSGPLAGDGKQARTGMAAMFCAVPRWPATMNTLSWFTSFCAASTAFFGS